MTNNGKINICILFTTFCIVYGSENNDDGRPLIIWWYRSIFPHVETGRRLYQVKCEKGLECYSSNNRTMARQDSQLTIIFYGSDFQADDVPLPRKDNQMWGLLHEESPQNNFILCQPEMLHLFNFTSTFKQQSDLPLTTQHIRSLGYLFERNPVPLSHKNKYRLKGFAPVVYLQSHCDVPSDRDRYVKELMKYINIDSYGLCLHNADFSDNNLKRMESMHDENVLDLLSKYKFHLAFENAICDDYITEKLYRALHVGSIPIYMGARNFDEWCPKSSVINSTQWVNKQFEILGSIFYTISVADFDGPRSLAELLHSLDSDDDHYLEYLDYKKNKHSLPRKVKEALKKRTWSAHDATLPHFVDAFECYVCCEMHKIAKGDTNLRIADISHLDCPPPKPSFGDMKGFSKDDNFHKWTEFYEQAKFQARAVSDIIQSNESDPKMLWEYVAQRMVKSHEEL